MSSLNRSGSLFNERREALKTLRHPNAISPQHTPRRPVHESHADCSKPLNRDTKATMRTSGEDILKKLQPDQEAVVVSEIKTLNSTTPNEKESFVSDTILLTFLLPVFDSKGRIVDLFHFEKAEIDNLSFSRNGLHPRSLFNTVWDLVVIVMFLIFTWLIPFFISFYDAPVEQFPLFSIVMTVTFALESITSVLTPQPKAANVLYSFREYESLRPTLNAWIQEWIGMPMIFEV
ncbi:hypothetical protein BCR33DRAFT_236984 [Rhizoclosmatium globosum]|uniref:Uncharacterized protein n=1 Tax=Rhizoclosmatium globosum TaxID=329046 RepID=A0A1Y2CAX9_9FUNG|nr:hypothetical protein BCR33DRAFT_236984 [Rhizoclosmatium globosum]|eukprot:ORY44190.1 hypothetical protein BCR33DRAFT_236984 [Rhizoclosmatium globosum]